MSLSFTDDGSQGSLSIGGIQSLVFNKQGLTTTPITTRQTVELGTVDSNGFPAFGGSTGSTTVTTATTLYLNAANGMVNRRGSITNPSWTGLSTNGTMYAYLDIASDGTCTTGSTTLAPVYQFGGAYSTTNGQFTFNIQEMTGKVGNGTTAAQTYRVFVGEFTVSGGVVTAIIWYALMGRYDSGWFSVAASLQYIKSHNIGCYPTKHYSFGASDSAGATSGQWLYISNGMSAQGGAWIENMTYKVASLLTDAFVRFMANNTYNTATYARMVISRGDW